MSRSHRIWITAFLLLSMFFLSSIFAVQGSLLSSMIDHFDLSPARQGLANAMAFLGGVIALVGAFSLQGRWKKRALVKASTLICCAGMALTWLAPVYWVYLAGWFVAGVGLGLMDTLLSACMADLYEGKAGVIMMCILHTVFGMSSVICPVIYTQLLSSGVNWQRIYLFIALCGAGLVAISVILRRLLSIADREQLSAQKVDLRGIPQALLRGGLLWLTAAIFFHGIFLSGLNTWVNRYADTFLDGVTFPAQSCVFLGIMISRIVMPFLPVKTEKYVVFGGLAGGAALMAGLLLGGGWPLRMLLIISALLFGALIPCILTLGCERQKGSTLLATTGIMLSLYIGQGVSSPLIAALESAAGLWAGMLLCALSMIACSLLCLIDQKKAA